MLRSTPVDPGAGRVGLPTGAPAALPTVLPRSARARSRVAGAGSAVAGWRVVPPEDGRFAELAAALPPSAHALCSDDDDERAVWAADDLLVAFFDAVADACARSGGVAPRDDHAAAAARWLAALATDQPVVELRAEEADLHEHVECWAAPVSRRDGRARARVCLQLHPPAADERDASWWLAYLVQAADDPSLVVEAHTPPERSRSWCPTPPGSRGAWPPGTGTSRSRCSPRCAPVASPPAASWPRSSPCRSTRCERSSRVTARRASSAAPVTRTSRYQA